MSFGSDVVLDNPAYIDPTARLYGKVRVGAGATIWCNVVARAEMNEIVIGPRTNIQDFVMLHVGDQTPTIIGANCSITHHCTIHGCSIGDNCLIGINATIMDGCVIGRNSIVAGGAFLKENTVIPDNSIVMGMPGKVVRTANMQVKNKLNAFLYWQNGLAYAKGQHRAWSDPAVLAAVAEEVRRLNAEFAAGG